MGNSKSMIYKIIIVNGVSKNILYYNLAYYSPGSIENYVNVAINLKNKIGNTFPFQYNKLQSIPSFSHFCLSPTSASFNLLSSNVVWKGKLTRAL
jgi:hypothetical protein